MRQKIVKFLSDLSATYRISDENFDRVINDTANYLMRNLPSYEINFDKVKDAIFDKYRPKSKVFPEPYFIKDCLVYGKIWNSQTYSDDGQVVTVEIPNKAFYIFEIAGCGKTLEEVKKEVAKNHGNSKVRIYPKGTVILGKTVVQP